MSQQAAIRALAMITRAKAKGNASDVSLSRPGSPGVYNPETSQIEGAADPATYTSVGVKVGYKQSDIDGSTIKQGDQQLYVPAKGFVRPVSNEVIAVGTDTFAVQHVDVVAPGDVDVLYILQIRGV